MTKLGFWLLASLVFVAFGFGVVSLLAFGFFGFWWVLALDGFWLLVVFGFCSVCGFADFGLLVAFDLIRYQRNKDCLKDTSSRASVAFGFDGHIRHTSAL